MRVRLFHKSGIPAGTYDARVTKTQVIVNVNGVEKKFSRKTGRQLGSPKLTLVYKEV